MLMGQTHTVRPAAARVPWRTAFVLACLWILPLEAKGVGILTGPIVNPANGHELWRVVERKQHSASTRPVFGHGLCYFPTGFGKGQLLAVDPNGKNDTTNTHII